MEEFKTKGVVKKISELIQIRRTQKPDLYKKILEIQLKDSSIFYGEIRNASLKLLEREGISENDLVELSFYFQSNKKNDNYFNNIIIKKIQKCK